MAPADACRYAGLAGDIHNFALVCYDSVAIARVGRRRADFYQRLLCQNRVMR